MSKKCENFSISIVLHYYKLLTIIVVVVVVVAFPDKVSIKAYTITDYRRRRRISRQCYR